MIWRNVNKERHGTWSLESEDSTRQVSKAVIQILVKWIISLM